MNTSELLGAALDWAVAQCEGFDINIHAGSALTIRGDGDWWNPSTDWAQGGLIIEREKITVEYTGDPDTWCACIMADQEFYGSTPLIAAMRCYVASKLGDEVEVPEGLK